MQRLKEIAELKQKRKKSKTETEKFYYDDQIFEHYFTLNADSALKYVNECIDLAEKNGNHELLTKSKINKSSLLAATGLLKAAENQILDISPTELNEDLLVDYYGQMIYLYSHLGNYTGGNDNDYYVTERLYKDSIMQVITPNHPDYLWYKGWNILGSSQSTDSIISALKKKLEDSAMNRRQDAMNAYILARLYQQSGDMTNYKNYMVLSAIADVRIANAEISSLEDLAFLMFEDGKGDIERAYTYIEYCLLKALDYPNRSRALGISATLERINRAHQEKLIKQRRDTIVFLVLFCILSFILILTLGAFFIQNKKLEKQRGAAQEANELLNQKIAALKEAEAKVSNINHQLQEVNVDLQRKNEELYESNFVKEEYIGYVFKLCSSYIAKIEELKRNIYLKAMKKQWKEIEYATSDLDMKEELKEFYNSFDTIFLHLYPNFVNDFNSLLKPDKQITLKGDDLLNMELRIYALIRLGINDSVKIADFLHCAPQTVYNYRLRARSRTGLSKTEFLAKIKSIGNFLGRKD